MYSADSKENLLLANQKDYFMPYMNGKEAAPPPSLSLPPCLHQLHIHRSAAQQHILPMQNSNYFTLLGWDCMQKSEAHQTWLLEYARGWMYFDPHDSWVLRPTPTTPHHHWHIYLKLWWWAYQKFIHIPKLIHSHFTLAYIHHISKMPHKSSPYMTLWFSIWQHTPTYRYINYISLQLAPCLSS